MPGNVHMVPGIPESLDKYLNADSSFKAMVFDDLMLECVNNNIIANAFTKKRHNKNVSVILLVQNLLCQGRNMFIVHLNTEYVVLFGNARDSFTTKQSTLISRREFTDKNKYKLLKKLQLQNWDYICRDI